MKIFDFKVVSKLTLGFKSFSFLLGLLFLEFLPFGFPELNADSLFKERKRILADTPVPKDLWLKTSRETNNFRVSYKLVNLSEIKAAEVLELEMSIEPKAGVKLVNFSFEAEMPKHMHGLGFKPKVVQLKQHVDALNNHKNGAIHIYRVKNLFFHMQGWWKMIVTLDLTQSDSKTQSESVDFDLMILK